MIGPFEKGLRELASRVSPSAAPPAPPRDCLRCGPQPAGTPIRPLFGLLLCAACSREASEEISARADALATERAERIASRRIAAHIPIEERDPIERVIRAAILAAGSPGLFEVVRALFNPTFPARIRQNRERAFAAFAKAGPDADPEAFAAGRAAGQELAALAIGRAITLLADPRCDLRAILGELREAVERVRDCEMIRAAAEHTARGEEPRPAPPRRRVVSGRLPVRSFHAELRARGLPPEPGDRWDPDSFVRWGDVLATGAE